MKVLYVCRLFTGIERILFTRRWEPTGVPTIYKVIEVLDTKADDFRLIVTCKEGGKDIYSSWKVKRDVELNINGLRHSVLVLSGDVGISRRIGRFNNHLRELRHTWQLWREIHRFKPDLLYLDHSNIWTAGLAARFLQIPVVFRIMGVYPANYKALAGRGLADRLLRWLYRAPFDLVICTHDGSNAENWMEKALNPKVHREILLNGVSLGERPKQPDARLVSIPKDRTNILYLGKLEIYKGCDYFVESILRLQSRLGDQLHALIIGVGNRREALIDKVEQSGASDMFTFIDQITHDQVVEAHARTDIYVSLNWFGTMSNANLEAMKAGACMIILESDPKHGYDVEAAKLLSPEFIWRVSRDKVIEELTNAIYYLHTRREDRNKRGSAAAEAAAKFIPSWEERIAKEMEMLSQLVRGKNALP